MKILKIVLMVALAFGVVSVFAGAVSAVDQTNNPLIAKGENVDIGAAPQTTGQNESENISKVNLNGAAKPEATNVENSTTSEPINSEVTDVTPVRSVDNSTEVGKEVNSTDFKSGNSRELTIDEMKSIKGKDWIDDAKRFVNGVVTNVINAVRPAFQIKFHSNQTDVHFEAGGHL
jgi:hypothetical protein